MARKVYKRAGIIHCCYKGDLWAPREEAQTQITVKDKVDVELVNGCLLVNCGDLVSEVWVKTVIGKDSPRKAPRSAPKQNGVSTKVTPEKPTQTSQKQPGEDGRPTEAEVDTMLQEAAPGDLALSIMRACWTNWRDSDRRLDLMQALRFESKEATSQVCALGQRLMDLFR